MTKEIKLFVDLLETLRNDLVLECFQKAKEANTDEQLDMEMELREKTDAIDTVIEILTDDK